jgi:hypothetical protein
MCVCDDRQVGNAVILKSAEKQFEGLPIFLDLVITRQDRWKARLEAWTAIGGPGAQCLAASLPINYCPVCGRRLSLGDAGKGD